MDNSFIVIPTRQIKSKSKRQQKKANKRKEDQIKKQLNKQLLSKRKAFTKSERKRIVEDLYNNATYKDITSLNSQINGLSDINELRSFLDIIISQVQKHVHNYEELIHQYQSTFLIDIRSYHYKIENYQKLFPLLNDYLNKLQNSEYGQNYEKATQYTTAYTILSTLTDLIMETLEDIEYDDSPKYVLEHIKRRFEQTARDAFYASKQVRQERAEEHYGLGIKMSEEQVNELLGLT